MHITYFFRKTRLGAFSIENLFLNIQQEFPEDLKYINHFLSRSSSGIFNRMHLAWEAYFKNGEVNHITGDINFIALLLPKSRTILTIHDIESLFRNNPFKNWLLQFFWLRMPVARVKYVTVVSAETKKKLLEHISVSPDKVVVIPNVISPAFTYVPKNFNPKRPILLQVGTKYNKNLERTIEAIAGINCKFVIVGLLTEYQEQLLELHSIDYENYVGVSEVQLRALYIEADIVTFVSLFEGFGMPIVEAQATGRPVITSNRSSMPEVAGQGALLVDPDNVAEIRRGVIQLLQNDDLRQDLVSKGLQNCKRFSNKAIAQQYLDLYKRI
jgi:glycosyltransferase involved in cell wall biosynthesis